MDYQLDNIVNYVQTSHQSIAIMTWCGVPRLPLTQVNPYAYNHRLFCSQSPTPVEIVHPPVYYIDYQKSQGKQNSRDFIQSADTVGKMAGPSGPASHWVSVFVTSFETAEEFVPERHLLVLGARRYHADSLR